MMLSRSSAALVVVHAGHLGFGWRGGIGRAGPGSLLMLPAGERFTAWTQELAEPRLQTVEVPHRVVDRLCAAHGAMLAQMPLAAAQQRVIVTMSADVRAAWTLVDDSLQRRRPGVLHEHLLEHLLLVLITEGVRPAFIAGPGEHLVGRVRRVMEECRTTDWRIETVARRIGLSSATLRRRLSGAGTSFRAVLEDARMLEALRQVLDADAPIHEIAQSCGYQCASRFTARFKARFGHTPREMRNGGGR